MLALAFDLNAHFRDTFTLVTRDAAIIFITFDLLLLEMAYAGDGRHSVSPTQLKSTVYWYIQLYTHCCCTGLCWSDSLSLGISFLRRGNRQF